MQNLAQSMVTIKNPMRNANSGKGLDKAGRKEAKKFRDNRKNKNNRFDF